MVLIQKAELCHGKTISTLALQLWPHHGKEELQEEFEALLNCDDAAVFLAFSGEEAVGFAQCQLRRDYVEGTGSSPVGYLEGIYVMPMYRKSGLARRLLAACENWAKEAGCREFASDCELSNTESAAFHLGVGFEEANRIICFVKKL